VHTAALCVELILVHSRTPIFLRRREMCSARDPRERLSFASNLAIPSRRSNRKCVVEKSLVCAYSDMAAEEESDEMKIEDDYIPGKSLNLVSTSNLVLLGMLIINFWVGVCMQYICVRCRLLGVGWCVYGW
jgi:hypothetical protein